MHFWNVELAYYEWSQMIKILIIGGYENYFETIYKVWWLADTAICFLWGP